MNIATGFAERLGHWRVRRNARDAGDARTARPQPGSCLPMVPADAGFFCAQV